MSDPVDHAMKAIENKGMWPVDVWARRHHAMTQDSLEVIWRYYTCQTLARIGRLADD